VAAPEDVHKECRELGYILLMYACCDACKSQGRKQNVIQAKAELDVPLVIPFVKDNSLLSVELKFTNM
jgi:hypothetical protein